MSNSYEVILHRNEKEDYEKEGVTYYGFEIQHSDGTPANLNFSHFCKIGIATIFGKDTVLQNKDYKAIFHIVFVNEKDEYKEIPNTKKARRLYMVKTGEEIKFFFKTGVPTIMNFNSKDEESVLKWIGFHNHPENEKVWFDFGATLIE